VASGPSYAQTGTIPVTTSGGRKKARMDFTAKFTNDTAKFQAARCCEVHQFIKWDSVYHKANGGPPHSGFPSSAAADTWIEDRDKKDKRYGHRTDAHSDPGSGCFDEYKSGGARDQANGDEYCGNDSPGTSRPGQFQFQLKAVDVCKSNAEIASSSVVTIDW
jgi:hypothetical protein